MSLADELEALLKAPETGVVEVADFVLTNQDAILSALRGRDAVLEDAAKKCEEPTGVCCGAYEYGVEHMGQREIVCCGSPDLQPMDAAQCAAAILAMKEGKQ